MRSLEEALALDAPSDDVAFLGPFDPADEGPWSELVREVVALANSGGGQLIVEGASTPAMLTAASIDEHVHRYTGSPLAGVRVIRADRRGRPVQVIEIEAEPYPLVFVSDATLSPALSASAAPPNGSASNGNGIKRAPPAPPSLAFARGTIWFRRGTTSVTGDVDDLRRAFEREIARRTDGWLENVRRVVGAPPGSVLSVGMPSDVAARGEPGVAVRLVSDPHAPALPRWSPDETHPHRLKHVVALVNDRLAGRAHINAFDLQCVRRVHGTDRVGSFFYRSKLDGPQYSDAFVDWIVEEHARNPALFADARAKAASFRAGADQAARRR